MKYIALMTDAPLRDELQLKLDLTKITRLALRQAVPAVLVRKDPEGYSAFASIYEKAMSMDEEKLAQLILGTR